MEIKLRLNSVGDLTFIYKSSLILTNSQQNSYERKDFNAKAYYIRSDGIFDYYIGLEKGAIIL